MNNGLWYTLGILTGVIVVLFLKEILGKRKINLFGLDKKNYDKAVKTKLDHIDQKRKKH